MRSVTLALACLAVAAAGQQNPLFPHSAYEPPAAAHKTGKVIILIQSGIHSGEIESQDTTLMLVRDIAVTKRYAGWLDHAIFVAITNFNLDGHEYFSPFNRAEQNGPEETGLRATPRGLNLNRDYMKADTNVGAGPSAASPRVPLMLAPDW